MQNDTGQVEVSRTYRPGNEGENFSVIIASGLEIMAGNEIGLFISNGISNLKILNATKSDLLLSSIDKLFRMDKEKIEFVGRRAELLLN